MGLHSLLVAMFLFYYILAGLAAYNRMVMVTDLN
jgi:uncharacterized membrane protein (DUF485 family)